MRLEPEQLAILEKGGAESLTLKTLVTYGEAFGAKRLVPVSSAHLAGSFGILAFSTYLKILDQLVAEGARVRVKTTLNPRPGTAWAGRSPRRCSTPTRCWARAPTATRW